MSEREMMIGAVSYGLMMFVYGLLLHDASWGVVAIVGAKAVFLGWVISTVRVQP